MSLMIKAFLCDETAFCSAEATVIIPILGHVTAHKITLVLLTNPQDTPTQAQGRLEHIPQLADTKPFVTHRENSHFERKYPTFFAEILARVGIEPNEALIISSSKSDIVAGQQLGVNGFHLTEGTASFNHYYGTWADFVGCIAQDNWADSYEPILLAPHMIAPQLIGNLGALQGLLQNIKSEFWHQHPDPQEWSAYQIMCHLLESEETVQRPRLEKILSQDNPFLSENINPPTPQCDLDETALADVFYTAREQTLAWLNTLPKEVWERVARHSIFGPTTFLEMAHFTAQHDRLHINQLCQTLQKCH
ncbi:MAG: DinB family protein [Phototrophicales bacterium]|nr:DinB family protein [Phototrophicales bacterium]